MFTPNKWTQLSKGMIVSGHNSCWGTNVSGHSHVCTQSCLGTNVVEPLSNYYSVQLIDGNADVNKLNVFKVDREVTFFICEHARLSESNVKTLNIEVKSEDQEQKLLTLTTLVDVSSTAK